MSVFYGTLTVGNGDLLRYSEKQLGMSPFPPFLTVLPGQGALFLADVLTTLPQIHASLPDLVPRAYAIADLTNASVYDSLYVALAERENCELVTADDKLVMKLQPHFSFVVPLSSLP